MPQPFPDYVRSRRHELGLSLFSLAAATGVTPTAISNYESGRAQPRLQTIARLAPALQLTPDELLHAAIDSAPA